MAPKKAAAAAAPAGSALPSADLLQDLCSRFILNCPEEELQSFERILFLVEQARRAGADVALADVALRRPPPTERRAARPQAHWFYEDFCRISGGGPALRSFSLREFAELMFEQHPSLERHKARCPRGAPAARRADAPARRAGPPGRHLQAVHDVQGAAAAPAPGTRVARRDAAAAAAQHNVPVYGAILLNPSLDKCLMVKGWKSGASWGFPKGKARAAHSRAARCCSARAGADAVCGGTGEQGGRRRAVRCARGALRCCHCHGAPRRADASAAQVYEETGFDVGPLIVETDYVETVQSQQRTKLYIIPNIDEQARAQCGAAAACHAD